MANKYLTINTLRASLLVLVLSAFSVCAFAQAQNNNPANGLPVPYPPKPQDTSKKNGVPIFTSVDDTTQGHFLTLTECINYALVHQPRFNQAIIGVNIAHENNGIALSGWLPQASVSGSLLHYLQQSNNSVSTGVGTGTTTTGTTGTTGTTTGTTGTTGSTGTTGTTGTITSGTTGSSGGSSSTISSRFSNTFVPELAVSQNIFSPSLLLASKSAPLLIKQAQQVTDSTKIFLVSSISKSFYNVLLTLEQINVLKEDTARLGKNVRDTYHQYKGGIVDETDYEEATITLNNTLAQLKQAKENIIPQYAQLKQLMGFPSEKQFNVSFDTSAMIRGIFIDTTQQLQFEKRIEFQQLATDKLLQNATINYYRTSFLPTVSAFFNYNLAYENNNFGNLLSTSYPSSIVGLSFNIPIFTGFARIHNLQKAKLQYEQLDWSEKDLKTQIYTEYTTALANYRGNLYNMNLLQQNVALAKRTYFVVTLQYKQGIVAYLNVITAESNLITSEISYINALFQVLSNKIDLQKAMGNITY
jgi:multidrug efflux system outer membrane protein